MGWPVAAGRRTYCLTVKKQFWLYPSSAFLPPTTFPIKVIRYRFSRKAIKTLLEKPGIWICMFLLLPHIHLLKLFFKCVFKKSYKPRHSTRVAVLQFTCLERKAGKKIELIFFFNSSYLIPP